MDFVVNLPRIVLIFEDENFLRRVDCNDQNFYGLMIFLYIRNLSSYYVFMRYFMKIMNTNTKFIILSV